MSAPAVPSNSSRWFDSEGRHRLRLRSLIFLVLVFFASLALEGYSFYSLPQSERVHHVAYDVYRPSGDIGLKLGLAGGVIFLLIYLYPIRKRWPWLRKIGNTKHWLDFHIVMGMTAPVLISFHSTFKFQGLAGMAFWIMWTVALSGVVGKYLYAKVPRLVTAAEMDMHDAEAERDRIAQLLREQDLVSEAELARLTLLPPQEEITQMSMVEALGKMVALDAVRLWRVAGLRRRHMSLPMRVVSMGGLLPVGNRSLEHVVRIARQELRLSTKICFLEKTHKLFHLWHVVHRPFSYSLAILAIVHIAFVISLGYF